MYPSPPDITSICGFCPSWISDCDCIGTDTKNFTASRWPWNDSWALAMQHLGMKLFVDIAANMRTWFDMKFGVIGWIRNIAVGCLPYLYYCTAERRWVALRWQRHFQFRSTVGCTTPIMRLFVQTKSPICQFPAFSKRMARYRRLASAHTCERGTVEVLNPNWSKWKKEIFNCFNRTRCFVTELFQLTESTPKHRVQ